MTMTYQELLERVITDGIAEVTTAYAAEKDRPKRDGAIAGFEACRGKAPAELASLYAEALRAVAPLRDGKPTKANLADYWRSRSYELQIEWVANVVSVGLAQAGQEPLLPWLPTARAAMKYAEIVGVSGAEAAP